MGADSRLQRFEVRRPLHPEMCLAVSMDRWTCQRIICASGTQDRQGRTAVDLEGRARGSSGKDLCGDAGSVQAANRRSAEIRGGCTSTSTRRVVLLASCVRLSYCRSPRGEARSGGAASSGSPRTCRLCKQRTHSRSLDRVGGTLRSSRFSGNATAPGSSRARYVGLPTLERGWLASRAVILKPRRRPTFCSRGCVVG